MNCWFHPVLQLSHVKFLIEPHPHRLAIWIVSIALHLLPDACVLISFKDSGKMKSVCDLHHVLFVLFEVLCAWMCASSECCVCCDFKDACLVEEGARKQVVCRRAVSLMVRIYLSHGWGRITLESLTLIGGVALSRDAAVTLGRSKQWVIRVIQPSATSSAISSANSCDQVVPYVACPPKEIIVLYVLP